MKSDQYKAMDEVTKILHSPFDFETHNKAFFYYCEVVIYPDGTIEYAVPSHQQKAIDIYCKKHKLTKDDCYEIWNKDLFWYDKVLAELGLVFVWYDQIQRFSNMTDKQQKALLYLVLAGCVSKDLEKYCLVKESAI